MLNIKFLRENSDVVKKNLEKRPKFDKNIVDETLKADEVWRSAKDELDKLKSQKNKESKAIA